MNQERLVDDLPRLTATDPAEGKNTSTAGAACGNPTILSSGNKVEQMLDYRANGDFPLEIVRNYNGHSGTGGMFGWLWMSKFDLRMVTNWIDDPTSWNPDLGYYTNQIEDTRLWRDDGSTIALKPNSSGGYDVVGQPPAATRVEATSQGLLYFRADGWKELYDQGRIKKIQNPQGVAWTFEYGAPSTGVGAQSFLKVTHTNGRFLQFRSPGASWQQNPTGRFEIVDPDGNIYAYYRQGGSGLISLWKTTEYPATQIDVLGNLRSDTLGTGYDFRESTLLSKRANGVVFASFDYYPFATPSGGTEYRVKSSQHANGADRFEFSYDPARQKTTARNPLGGVTNFDFSSGAEVTTTQRVAGIYCPAASTSLARDATGLRKVERDEDNIQTETTFDALGNTIRVVEGYGSPLARTTQYEWAMNPRRMLRKTAPGLTLAYDYDNTFRVRTISATSTVPGANYGVTQTTSYTYVDADGNGLPERVVIDGPLPGSADAVTYLYDAAGNLIQEQRSTGVTYYSGHDGSGRPAQIQDENGVLTTLKYDARGRVIEYAKAGAVSKYAYNVFGDVLQMMDPSGSVTSYLYDAAHRLVGVERNDTFRQGISNGQVMKERQVFTLDAAGNTTGQSTARNASTLTAQFADFDEFSRMRSSRGSDGQRLTFERTPAGRLVKTTDVTGLVVERRTYDALGRTATVTDAKGGITQFSYDAADNVILVRDARGNGHTRAYDGFGNLTEETSPDAGRIVYGFNYSGQPVTATLANGRTVSTTYQDDGRIRTLTSSQGGSSITRTYGYDYCAYGRGRVCGISESTGEIVDYAYTPLGSISSQRNTISGQEFGTRWEYFSSGQLSGIIYPNGAQLWFSVQDGLPRYAYLSFNGSWLQVVGSALFQPSGAVERFTDFSGATRAFSYDGSGRLTTTGGRAPISFGYDVRDNLTSLSGAVSGTVGYDELSRVTSFSYPGVSAVLNYDGVGNRTATSYAGSPAAAYATSGTSNQLQQVTVAGWARQLSYDASGNLVRDFQSGTNAVTCHAYDAFGRTANVSRYSGSVCGVPNGTSPAAAASGSYRFNGLNQRSQKVSGGTTTKFIYGLSGELLYEVSTGAISQAKAYVWFGGQIVAMTSNSDVLSVNTDQTGRPTQVFAAGGSLRWSATNRAFDRQVDYDAIGGLNVGFPGQYYDAESGLWQNWHRTYDASLGRYTQSDPAGLAGGINTYSYVSGNPLTSVDPFGLVDLNLFAPGTKLRNFAANITSAPGTYTIAGHGNPSNMENASRVPISPRDLAAMIRNDPAASGKTIVLYSCNVGTNGPKGTASFAQQVSTMLGQPVIGPDNYAWFSEDGFTGAFPMRPFPFRMFGEFPDRSRPGAMRGFIP